MFSSGARGCSVSTVKNHVPLANVYRLQPIATDSQKTMSSVTMQCNLFNEFPGNHYLNISIGLNDSFDKL